MTVLAWVLHLGEAGPIFNYNRGPRWGVHLWMTKPRQFFARFVRRDGRFTTPLVTHGNNVRYKAWNYVGATYDGNTGMATLWVNNRPVVRSNIGRIRLATNRPVRMGAKIGDRRYFRGRVSCVQVYSVALNRKQIIEAAKRCFKRKLGLTFLSNCRRSNHHLVSRTKKGVGRVGLRMASVTDGRENLKNDYSLELYTRISELF